MNMYSHTCVLTAYTVTTICLIATGSVRSQWRDERRAAGISGWRDGPAADRPGWRDTYDSDLDRLDSGLGDNGDSEEKRSYASDGYQRHPRIKQIIPFYSYRHMAGYRPRARYFPRPRPWNRNDYYSAWRSSNRGPPIYGGY